ncbi:MAG: hypothetical protein ACUVWP_01990 [bacterium]
MKKRSFFFISIVILIFFSCKAPKEVVSPPSEEVVIKTDSYYLTQPNGWRLEYDTGEWDVYLESPQRKINVIVSQLPHLGVNVGDILKMDEKFMTSDNYEVVDRPYGVSYKDVESGCIRYICHKPDLEGRYTESHYFFKDGLFINIVISYDSETGKAPEDVNVFFNNFTPFPQ